MLLSSLNSKLNNPRPKQLHYILYTKFLTQNSVPYISYGIHTSKCGNTI